MAAPTEEELRAEQYQRDVAARHAFQAELDGKLHGSESARHALDVAWDPYVQWMAERDIVIPPEDDEH